MIESISKMYYISVKKFYEFPCFLPPATEPNNKRFELLINNMLKKCSLCIISLLARMALEEKDLFIL